MNSINNRGAQFVFARDGFQNVKIYPGNFRSKIKTFFPQTDVGTKFTQYKLLVMGYDEFPKFLFCRISPFP